MPEAYPLYHFSIPNTKIGVIDAASKPGLAYSHPYGQPNID
jgi:hypothetical protein